MFYFFGNENLEEIIYNFKKSIISDFEEIYKYIYDLYQKDFYEIDYLLKWSADSQIFNILYLHIDLKMCK